METRGPAVFVTGGTGYLGVPLIQLLVERGFEVHALVRRGSEGKLPAGSLAVIGDALDAATFAAAIPTGATLVHLVGTPHLSTRCFAHFPARARALRGSPSSPIGRWSRLSCRRSRVCPVVL